MKSNIKKNIIEILIIGTIIFLINTFIIQICFVKGNSMYPTLKNGQILFMRKFNIKPQSGDIAVIKHDGKIIIKRVIAISNDKIVIKDGYVYLNDKKIDDNYTYEPGIANDEIILGKDEFFVLGDNRQESIDSRFEEIGIIKSKEIIGIIF